MHLMALTLAYLVPEAEEELMGIALDVAVNRERAGLHYPSDTKAGRELAGQIFGILTRECPLFQSTLMAAKGQEWPRGKWQGRQRR
jgi:membrane-associated phospholipid phosphatase